jgi:FAD/FMN-containing dehydrogenase
MISRRSLLRTALATSAVTAGVTPQWNARSRSRERWLRLRRRLDGDLILPGDTAYPTARQLDNGYFDTVEPSAIAYCATVADVRAVLRFAQDEDVATAVRSGGHSAAGYSTTTGVVLDVSRLDRIEVGPSTVSLGPGTQGVDLVAALAPYGAAAVTGNCPTVCAGGYLQGGGIGPLARKYGVASDRVVAAQVVLADGRVERVSAHHEPELFWALWGGGGGNFGVVTRFEIRPAAVDRMVTYSLVWPWSRAAQVIAAFQPWLRRAPHDLAGNLNLVVQNAFPGAVPSVSVSGGWFGGGPESLIPYLDALIAAVGTAPVRNQVDDLTYSQAMMRYFGCADRTVDQCHRAGTTPEALLPRHSYVVNRGRLLDGPLPPAAVDALLAAFESAPTAGQLRVVSWAGLGGRINEVDPAATAYVHRSAQFYVAVTAGLPTFTPSSVEETASRSWADGCFAVIAPHGAEGQVNFIDPALPDWRTAYYGANYSRLARIKRRYDPHGFFRFPQAVGS